MVTRKSRFLAGSVLKMMNSQVNTHKSNVEYLANYILPLPLPQTTLRLAWVIQNNKALQEAIASKTAMFGTLDSWLLYRLRQGTSPSKHVEHIADVSSCSATGFYDPFTLSWAQWAFKLFSLHGEMMPTVVSNSHDFGATDRSIFGHEIKIGCSVSNCFFFVFHGDCNLI